MCVNCISIRSSQAADAAHCRCGAPETLAAYRRIEADLSRRQMIGGMAAVLGMFAGFGLAPGYGRAQTPPAPLLLSNLKLFDGRNLSLRDGVSILIEAGRVSALPPEGQGPPDAERIDCGGLTVIPGLIDAHWHATLAGIGQLTAMTADIGYVHLVAAKEAGATLRRGFTTVRDVGGPSFALKRAIDEAIVEGPRIFPSGAMISQTSGHGDFRLLNELPRAANDGLSYTEKAGLAAIADGADAVLMRTREQLMRGASQIKVMAGGGVSSLHDPLDAPQYTERELHAAVEAASDWGTYVCAHVYTPEGITRSIRAGIRCIEHGQLTDENAVRMMADEDIWWSLQPFFGDEDANVKTDPGARADQARVATGTEHAYRLALEHKVRVAFGTDILMAPNATGSQGRQLAKLTRFMSPLEVLRMATGANGELLAMSGARAPYDGKLGVVEPGAFADLLVVEGDILRDLSFLADTEKSLRLILKGGKPVKKTI
jgi:imidazolonepropionase-like amidohydrolase